MVRARFYIENKVQGVGYRPFIIQKILDSDLEGTARNLPDGRIEVLLEGKKKSILEFVELLKKEKPELAGNPTVSEIDFDIRKVIPKAMRSSQALMLGQFGKGIVVLNEMNEGIKGMKEGIKGVDEGIKGVDEGIKGMKEGIKGVDEGIKGMKEGIKGVDEGIKGVGEGIKNVDKKLDALNDIKKLLEEIAKK